MERMGMTAETCKSEFGRILELIDNNDRFLMIGHIDPDGDCLGSMFAMTLFVRARGKDVACYAPGDMPERLLGLPGADSLVARDMIASFDPQVVIALDSPTHGRTENVMEIAGDVPVVNMDHHPSNEMYGEVNVVDENAAAAAMLVLRFLESVAPESITPDIASCLYLGILMDTGSFRFQNTDEEALSAAGRLIGYGARAYELTHEFVYMKKFRTLKLLVPVLDSLKLSCEGKIATMQIKREMLESSGAEFKDSEGFIDYGAAIDDVELVALLREIGPDRTRVSLRSRNHHDVSLLAGRYGGGGHAKAAGLTIKDSIDNATKTILRDLEGLVSGR